MPHFGSFPFLRLGLALAALAAAEPAHAAAQCARTFHANVVALDQPLMFNRLGAQNVNGTVYALARDVVNVDSKKPLTAGGLAAPGRVELRPDKRPRPLVLRVAAGDCLTVTLQNLLTDVANPNDADHAALQIDDQVAGRHVGFHVAGLEPFTSADDGAHVGRNPSSLAPPGGSAEYRFHAPREGAFAVTNPGAAFGGEGSQGASATGLFGAVNVEPRGARFYRSQVTAEELKLATVGTAPGGQPILDFDAVYPATRATPEGDVPSVWVAEGKAGLPVLRMTTSELGGEIVHGDLNAVVAGPEPDGRFPPGTYPLESVGRTNPSLPKRLEAFREFTVIFHDEVPAAQAFPGYFEDPVFKYTLHGVRDAFMVNYGSGGVGAEIVANRLGVGPMHDCLNCSYEEFFLASSAVGDPAMLVDAPANLGLELVKPGVAPPAGTTGPKATRALFPDDPSNVHHGYTGDHVKFRNVHVGKEHHVFHLHNHQWLYNPNDDNSNYIDAQGLGPGSGYTYEINFGGGGNRNKTAGDAIFHCHFYPHFAQGMWAHWRNHDVMETGTELAVSGGEYHAAAFDLRDGTPAPGARALPDGEIVAGTPIPALVPIPGKAMAPMPGRVTVRANDHTTVASALHADPLRAGEVVPVGSLALVDRTDQDLAGNLKNPGYPFWIAGIEDVVGQRPPTPPLDMLTEAQATALGKSKDPLFAGRGAALAASAGGHDGGLPRHALHGVSAGGVAVAVTSRLDMSKIMKAAKPTFYPETGTDVERAAMRAHAIRNHPSTAVLLTKSGGTVDRAPADFVLNGQKPMPSAPYHEPCVDDLGNLVVSGGTPSFFDGNDGTSPVGTVQRGATNPRTYKAAAVQIDAVFNKVGWHYPQERITALWEDVLPTINKQRPPEPFVIRFNTLDCAKYLHTNLVPEFFELDDYQVRTPTDVIGQHIHLPKWDLTTTDGAANGWNYEDGTLSPGSVRERIDAINEWNAAAGAGAVKTLDGKATLAPVKHPYFPEGPVAGSKAWLGARTTIQRWFMDPVVNVDGKDRGLGIIFTHDHYGPSTHQQIGLYASVLVEPAGSSWVHNESGVALGTRHDGGPTSWQAVIRAGPSGSESYREFWFQASDFQHAYEPGVYVGANDRGVPDPALKPTTETFRFSVNPGAREQTTPALPDLVSWAPVCPGGVQRPCPEAISAADPGMFVVNYRNEPVGLRVYDPAKLGPDGKPGAQADGLAGDLAYAFESRADRRIRALGTALGDTPYPPLTNDVQNGDPFTPLMRAVAGDTIRVKAQMGGHEEEHVTTIHGLKWLQGGSAYGQAPNSGWRNTQAHGISEQFTFEAPLTPFVNSPRTAADYLYSANPSQDGWWSGAWGILRTYDTNRTNLVKLPNNPGTKISNARDFDVNQAGLCPKSAPRRTYEVSAVLANAVLPAVPGVSIVPQDDSATQHVGTLLDPAGGTLVYNPRATPVAGGRSGPLHDPTAMLYVFDSDLEAKDESDPGCWKIDAKTGASVFDSKLATCPVRLKAGVPTEPIVLRAAAGECVEVTLRNRLPGDLDGNGVFDDNPDLANYTTLMTIVARDRGLADPSAGVTTFNNNLIRPSSHVGLHPQLVAYDVTKADGTNVGRNNAQTQSPGGTRTYRWYMGDLRLAGGKLVATPIELGGTNLLPADKIKQGQKALGGALVVLPEGSAWTEDADRRSAASVGQDLDGDGRISGNEVAFRDFALMISKSMSHRFADGSPVPSLGGDDGSIVTEDTQDAGQIAVNNATEPLWFRFGLAPNSPLGNTPGGLGGVENAELAFSNALAGGDPVTPVFRVGAGRPFRLHVLEPHGAFRGSVLALHGHVWQRDPYVCPGSHLGLAGKCAPGELGSRSLGVNPVGFALGGQDGIHPYSHFDLYIPSAGGSNGAAGDWLFRDMGGFGVTSGLWGIVRAGEAP